MSKASNRIRRFYIFLRRVSLSWKFRDFECDIQDFLEVDGMNADDIFRKLSRGVSFDRRKFKEDAENLGIIEKKDEPECEVNAKDSIFITPMNQSEEPTNENIIIEEFEEKVEKRILSNLENVLKWEKPTRIQMAAIDILLKVIFLL